MKSRYNFILLSFNWHLFIHCFLYFFVCLCTDKHLGAVWAGGDLHMFKERSYKHIERRHMKSCIIKWKNRAHLNWNWKPEKFSRLDSQKVLLKQTFQVQRLLLNWECTLKYDQVVMCEQYWHCAPTTTRGPPSLCISPA